MSGYSHDIWMPLWTAYTVNKPVSYQTFVSFLNVKYSGLKMLCIHYEYWLRTGGYYMTEAFISEKEKVSMTYVKF